MLLQHVRGAQSFDHLKTVNCVQEETFKATAIKLNLNEDDSEWERCLGEACNVCIPSQIRLLSSVSSIRRHIQLLYLINLKSLFSLLDRFI